MRIICVDSDKMSLRRTMRICRGHPWVTAVTGFTDCTEAMSWIRNNPCDVAIMETMKPGFNGLKLAAGAQKLRPNLAILFVTDEKIYGLDAFELHAVGYVLKPIKRERLAEKIEYIKGEWMPSRRLVYGRPVANE